MTPELEPVIYVTGYTTGRMVDGVAKTWQVLGAVGPDIDGEIWVRWQHPDQFTYEGTFQSLAEAKDFALAAARVRDCYSNALRNDVR
jgi:hypothetical protein